MTLKILIVLAWQSMLHRRGAVLLTVIAIAVSVFTLLGVEHLRHTTKNSFSNTVSGVDLIVGPRTSDINLLLTTVFRIGQPSLNMSWESYTQLKNHPDIAWTIPISLGDSHKSFRVVGTQAEFFTHFKYGSSKHLTFEKGEVFNATQQVVLGASIARKLNYRVKQKIIIAHGLGKTSFQMHDAHPFFISGILKPTGTPVDNALYVSLAGLEAIHQPQAQSNTLKETAQIQPTSISAAMIGLNSKFATFKIQREINGSTNEPLSAILPGVTLAKLWQMSRGLESALNVMGKLILFASLLGMGAVIIVTLRERSREFSILRTLGAGPWLVFFLIQMEALLIAILGIALAYMSFLLTILLFSENLAVRTGIDIGINQFSLAHGFVALYVVAGAVTTSVVPALTGYFRARKL